MTGIGFPFRQNGRFLGLVLDSLVWSGRRIFAVGSCFLSFCRESFFYIIDSLLIEISDGLVGFVLDVFRLLGISSLLSGILGDCFGFVTDFFSIILQKFQVPDSFHSPGPGLVFLPVSGIRDSKRAERRIQQSRIRFIKPERIESILGSSFIECTKIQIVFPVQFFCLCRKGSKGNRSFFIQTVFCVLWIIFRKEYFQLAD